MCVNTDATRLRRKREPHLVCGGQLSSAWILWARRSLRRPERVGFVRDLSELAQRDLGVHVDFRLRQKPFDPAMLLGVQVAWDAGRLRMVAAPGVVADV